MDRALATVSVEWLLKNLEYSIDLGEMDFEYLLADKLDWHIDESFGENCLSPYYSKLLDMILTLGFTKPICVYLQEELGTGRTMFAQGNGHHRLAIAILLGLNEIPVVFSFDGEYMQSDITT